MARDSPQSTPRRSQRFQPTATSVKELDKQLILDCLWEGKPVHVRTTIPDLDLLPEELEERETQDDEQGEDKEESEELLETVFYEAFRMKRRPQTYRGKKSKQVVTSALKHITYRVGDTILVETDAGYIVKKPPSIGVIVAMWQTRPRLRDGESEADRPLPDATKMRVRIHWFIRPSEMAAIRAKRESLPNECYYSLNTRVVISPGAILSRCTVLDRPAGSREVNQSLPSTPSKRKGVPSTPQSRFWAVEDEEEGSKAADDSETFFCRYAVDSRRGLFYNFAWQEHLSWCRAQQRTPLFGEDEPGPSSRVVESSSVWGDGSIWDVKEKKTADEEDAAEKVKPGKKRVAKRTKELPDTMPQLRGVASESEDGGTDDGFDGEALGSDESDAMEVDGVSEDEGEGVEPEEDEDSLNPRTPSKKRRRNQTASPRKRGKGFAEATPHSKAALKKRTRQASYSTSPTKRKSRAKFVVQVPEQSLAFQAGMAKLPKDPWIRAMHALHVGSRPDALPCRDQEFDRILRSVGDLLEEGSGGCIYISGVPGTGKTATVHAVVRQLRQMAEDSEINPFTYVEINGLKIPEPAAAYTLLWEGISNHDVEREGHLRIGSKESLKALTRYFTGGGNRGPGGHACVVLMDELDQLVTPKQDVVYNFFNWPTLVNSKLVVIAVANTMDLPERVMTGRVRSRLGMTRINFQPYSRDQLEQIVQARLDSSKEGLENETDPKFKQAIIVPDAIRLAAMTVSRITGDARRVLDICRRAVELVQEKKTTVKPPHIKEVVQVMQNSPTAAFLRDLSFHERLMLASLIKCIKREGVEEIKWGDVRYQHDNFVGSLATDNEPTRKPTDAEYAMILDSLVASRAVVLEEGALVLRKGEAERRMLLNLEQGEVERVLSDIGGDRWRNVLCN